MKRLLATLLLIPLLLFTGCDEPLVIPGIPPSANVPVEKPTVNVPYALREPNWLGRQRSGSCVHASFIMLLRWQGQYELADWWRANHGDGEYAERLASKLDAAGVQFAYTSGANDVAFLEWACETRRGAGVTVLGGLHMVCLVGLDENHAYILDNNHIERIKKVPRNEFLAEWRSSNSWAVTPIMGAPAAPLSR